jgi:MATE family multidrug resistance protein
VTSTALAAWRRRQRYGDVTRVCLPLVLSTAAITVMEFCDRVFLANYDLDAISAATPAGVLAFLCIIFFSGVVGYASVFVAQFTGAGAPHRIGAVIRQALYLSAAAGLFLAALAFLLVPAFRLAGHPPEIVRLETAYFRVLCLGGGLHVAQSALAALFTGLGRTRPVLAVNVVGMAVNIPLNFALINGRWGAPELGIVGAGLATVTAWLLMLIIYGLLVFTPANERRFRIRSAGSIESDLCRRLLRYGIPGALQFCLDVFAFLFFIFMVGRLGKSQMAVSNIVIAINSLAFMPAMGVSQGVSTLVGQSLGRNRPRQADAAVWSAAHLLWGYTALVAVLYLAAPQWVLSLFVPSGRGTPEDAAVVAIGVVLLRMVTAYVFLDATYMTLVGALKGAGDTRFIMVSIGAASLVLMILPVVVGIEWLGMGIYFGWGCIIVFVAGLCGITLWRYRQGKWRSMRVVGTTTSASSNKAEAISAFVKKRSD